MCGCVCVCVCESVSFGVSVVIAQCKYVKFSCIFALCKGTLYIMQRQCEQRVCMMYHSLSEELM